MSAKSAMMPLPSRGLPMPSPVSPPAGISMGERSFVICLSVILLPSSTMLTDVPCVSANAGCSKLCCGYS